MITLGLYSLGHRVAGKCLATILFFSSVAAPIYAADHADAPNTSNDPAADLNDSYIFLDPNDNGFLVVLMTVRGFIVPGEAVNQGIFDPGVLYRFQIENTGDPKPDLNIDVRFNPRMSTALAQMATVTLPGGQKFLAPATNPSVAATPPAPVLTVDPKSNVTFFAGEVDDPFFFDIPGFARFSASVRAGKPDASLLTRGRDSFAGYNTMAIALRFPLERLRGKKTPLVGLNVITYRGTGSKLVQVDRAATPAVNVALIPFAKKNAFNLSNPIQDAAAKFAEDIVDTLILFGADDQHVAALAKTAVFKGDYIRLDTTVANTGPGGGTNPETRFPNGRRLVDDTIDIILTAIANGQPFGDNVNANDVPLTDTFPFFGRPQQPLAPGAVDDNTRN